MFLDSLACLSEFEAFLISYLGTEVVCSSACSLAYRDTYDRPDLGSVRLLATYVEPRMSNRKPDLSPVSGRGRRAGICQQGNNNNEVGYENKRESSLEPYRSASGS